MGTPRCRERVTGNPRDGETGALASLVRPALIVGGLACGVLYSLTISWLGMAVNEAEPLIFTHILIAESPFGLGAFLWPLIGAALAFRADRPVRLAILAALFAHYGWLVVKLPSSALSPEGQYLWLVPDGPVFSIPALSLYLAGQVLVWAALARGAARDARDAGVRLKGRWDALLVRVAPSLGLPSRDERTDYRIKDARGRDVAIGTTRQLALLVRTRRLIPSSSVFDPERSAWVPAWEVEGIRPLLQRARSLEPTAENAAAGAGRGRTRAAATAGGWGIVHLASVALCIAAVAGVLLCRRMQPAFLGDGGFSYEFTLVAAFFAALLAFVAWSLGRERWPRIGLVTFTTVFTAAVVLHIFSVANGIRTTRNTAEFLDRTGGDAEAAEGERITWWRYGPWKAVIEGTVELDRESRRLLGVLHAGYETEWRNLGSDNPLSSDLITSPVGRTRAIEAMTRLRNHVDEIERQNLAAHAEYLRRLDSVDFPEWIVRSSESKTTRKGKVLGDIGPELIESHRKWIDLTLQVLEFLQAENGRYYFNQGRPIFASSKDAANFNSLVSRVASARRDVKLTAGRTDRATTSINPGFRDEDSQPVRAPAPSSRYTRPSFEREQRARQSEVVDEIRGNEVELCRQNCFSDDCTVGAMRILESSPEELRLELRMRCVDEEFTVTAFMRRHGERWLLEY